MNIQRTLVFALGLILSAASFANAPYLDSERIIQAGDGYQLKELTYIDAGGVSRSVELFYIHNVEGATNAYLEAGLPLQELADIQEEVDSWGGIFSAASGTQTLANTDTDVTQHTWVIDKRGASITSDAEGQAYINEFNLQAVVDEERQFPDGDIQLQTATSQALGASARLFGCSGWREKSKRFRKGFDEDFTIDRTIGSGVATVTFSGELDIDADADLNLSYRYKRNFICIPYKFRFKNLDAKANYEATGDFSVVGKLEKNFGNVNWKIAEPKVFDFWFAVGPVPVRLAGKLPIEAGTGDIKVTVTGEISTYKRIHFKGNMHYVCNSSRCTKIASNHQNLDNSLNNTVGAAISAKASIKPYVHVAIKPYLYGEWFLYAKFGAKPSFPIEVFGYYGNLCEDGDDNGTNELIAALLGTIAFEVGATGEAKIFGAYILRPQYWKIWEKDLLMVDFLPSGSSAFSPVLRPSVSSTSNLVTLPVKVRSCVDAYSQRFPVDYRVFWGDGSSSTLADVGTSKTLSHTYATPGQYTVVVTYKNSRSTTVNLEVGDDWGGIF